MNQICPESFSFIGLLIYGSISDKKGRKVAFKISWRFYTIGLVLYSSTQTQFLITLGYFVACVNCFASLVIQFVLLFEQIGICLLIQIVRSDFGPAIFCFLSCWLLLCWLLFLQDIWCRSVSKLQSLSFVRFQLLSYHSRRTSLKSHQYLPTKITNYWHLTSLTTSPRSINYHQSLSIFRGVVGENMIIIVSPFGMQYNIRVQEIDCS